jgi:hypothetical protein
MDKIVDFNGQFFDLKVGRMKSDFVTALFYENKTDSGIVSSNSDKKGFH